MVLSAFVTGTFAYWSDAVAVSGAKFTAGTIDLRVNNLDTVTGYTSLNISTMVPGNSMAGVLTIRNNGTAPLKYTAVTTATNTDGKNLRGSLVVKVTGAATATGSSPAMTCGGTALTGSQTTLNGSLLSTARMLAAGASETLCVQITLDAAASTTLQGATTDVVFTFNATSDLA
ncbi:hypothetical protein GCM10023146_42570 [Nocardioides caricicola]